MKQDYFDWKSQQAVNKQEETELNWQKVRSQLTPEELAWQNEVEEMQFVIIIVLVASWGAYWYFSIHL
jgi:hypothetical protein